MSPPRFGYAAWEQGSPAWRGVCLFLVSCLGLFLEILLIDWPGTRIRVFAGRKSSTPGSGD